MNEPQPDQILQVGLGFWASKTLLSAVEMELIHRTCQTPGGYRNAAGAARPASEIGPAVQSLWVLAR